MSGARSVPRGRRRALAVALAFAALTSAPQAGAAACPGNPEALGTFRTVVVDPVAHSRIGTMQYGETLPLRPGEVVLTFDDGPLPRQTNKILDILAAECVKATFFLVGRMARQFPAGVRRIHDEGHTVGTHSENHPLNFDRMAPEEAQREIDQGIDAVKAALGDPARLAPFFRIPGLRRTATVEDYLASKGIMTWSADFPADDWRPIAASQVASLALSRLAAKGKGILLLHDIQPRTVEALPVILRELKARGYRIVHVVPAVAQRPPTPTEPWQWRLRPPPMPVAQARWPAPPRFVFVAEGSFPAPEAPVTKTSGYENHALPVRAGRSMRAPQWPRAGDSPVANALGFSIPALDLFTIQTFEADAFATGRLRRTAGAAEARRQNTPARPAVNAPLRLVPGSAAINEAGLHPAAQDRR